VSIIYNLWENLIFLQTFMLLQFFFRKKLIYRIYKNLFWMFLSVVGSNSKFYAYKCIYEGNEVFKISRANVEMN